MINQSALWIWHWHIRNLHEKLIFEREMYVLALAMQWFFYDQLPALVQSLLRVPGSLPPALILAELRGCLAGPWIYLSTRKKFVQNLPVRP